MDATFILMFKMIMVYLDDLTIFSNYYHKHIKYLDIIFKRCREFRMSLKPNKYVFVVNQGKLLRHITSKGVRFDPKTTKAILHLQPPYDLKGVK